MRVCDLARCDDHWGRTREGMEALRDDGRVVVDGGTWTREMRHLRAV